MAKARDNVTDIESDGVRGTVPDADSVTQCDVMVAGCRCNVVELV